MSYFNQNKYNLGNQTRQKASVASSLKPVGFQEMANTDSLDKTKLAKRRTPESKDSGMGVGQALGIAEGALSLFQDDSPELDKSGNTDYTGTSASDVGAGAMDVIGDTVNYASKGAAVGGLPGAAIGGVIGLGKGLLEGGKQKEKLKQAKKRFQNKQRYQSEKQIDKISDSQKMSNIVGQENLEYVENLKSSPSYNRFKRNSQYTI